MIRSAAGKVMWVGRATVFLVGLAVILALVFGAATTAMGADGKPFLLGKRNVATLASKLINRGEGPALSLKVGEGQPPLAVNSSAKVANLNSDQIDGLDSTDLQTNPIGTYNAYTQAESLGNQAHGYRADCESGDVMRAGGYSHLSPGAQIVTCMPDGGGWFVSISGGSTRIVVECFDYPPAHVSGPQGPQGPE